MKINQIIYTTETLISITIKISTGLNTLILPLWIPLALDNCRCLSSRSTKFSVVIENALGYSFYANHSLDGPMDARWPENTKILFLQQNAYLFNGDFNVQNLP